MPPPKQLTQETYTSLKARVVTRFTPFDSQMLDDRFRAIQHFQPPQTYQAWLDATNVKGKLFGTKSRGDRLQAVDRAYKAWIEYNGEEGIVHWRNAENLANALEKYRGVVYHAGNQVSGLSHDYRNERDKGDVMSKTLSLCRLLQRLCVDSPVSDVLAQRSERRAMLALMANIKVKWSPTKTLAFGALSLGATASGMVDVDKAVIDILLHNVVLPVGVAGAVAGTGYVVANRNSLMEKVKTYLQEQIKSFTDWIKKIFGNFFSISTAADLLQRASRAFAYIAKIAMQEVAKFASNGADIYAALRSHVTDAWTRTTLSLQQAELVTSDGAFAMIRKGIDAGIRNRQHVAKWNILKGAGKTVATVVTSGPGEKIASLVLGGFQLVFKVIYNLVENHRIKKFIAEARTMWTKVQNATDQLAQPDPVIEAAVDAPGVAQSFRVPKAKTGYMPAFKAAHYTAAEFLDDRKAAYLNFLHSLVDASPILAAIVMNSDAFKSVDDVMHIATPRSTDDVDRATTHIQSLKIEAKRLYKESGFKISPEPTSNLGWADLAVLLERLTAAQFLEPG